ncbi:ABC transporter substrate-binding protein [Pseudoroseomonas wenyumeiae]
MNSKIVALAADSNTGWRLMVRNASPVQSLSDLAGKKIGITAAGSLSDFMALWTRSNAKIAFTSVPLGGGGLVPNLLNGNVDAAIIYSPLSFQLLQRGQARVLLDYATAIPAHLAVGWSATDQTIAKRQEVVKATLQAVYGAVAHLRRNRDAAIATIAEVNDIPPSVAAQEYEETFLKISTDGRFTLEQTRLALDLARIGGFDNLAPAEEIVDLGFVPVTPAA